MNAKSICGKNLSFKGLYFKRTILIIQNDKLKV